MVILRPLLCKKMEFLTPPHPLTNFEIQKYYENEPRFISEIGKIKLSDQIKFRLYEIKRIENYFINEINERKSCSKKLSKYVTTFDYIDKILIILSTTSGGISIISFTGIIGEPAGIASASFTLIFSIITGIIKKLLNITRSKKKKHDKILMLAKSKFSRIEILISQALNDVEISHKEFITISEEKDRYEKIKENIRGKFKIKNKKS